jgi:hypothetical protein
MAWSPLEGVSKASDLGVQRGFPTDVSPGFEDQRALTNKVIPRKVDRPGKHLWHYRAAQDKIQSQNHSALAL